MPADARRRRAGDDHLHTARLTPWANSAIPPRAMRDTMCFCTHAEVDEHGHGGDIVSQSDFHHMMTATRGSARRVSQAGKGKVYQKPGVGTRVAGR